MEMEEKHMHPEYYGGFLVWDYESMHHVSAGVCGDCKDPFDDGDEFLALECFHMEHIDCI